MMTRHQERLYLRLLSSPRMLRGPARDRADLTALWKVTLFRQDAMRKIRARKRK